MANDTCRFFLTTFRKEIKAKPAEKIDKRYRGSFGWLAPNNKYYNGHCGYCAEIKYLEEIHTNDH